MFHDTGTDYYYINRGLERGYTLEGLETQVLNKKATLHLAKVLNGTTSNHIAQLAVEGKVLFIILTEVFARYLYFLFVY